MFGKRGDDTTKSNTPAIPAVDLPVVNQNLDTQGAQNTAPAEAAEPVLDAPTPFIEEAPAMETASVPASAQHDEEYFDTKTSVFFGPD